jgi:hypothetical protein
MNFSKVARRSIGLVERLIVALANPKYSQRVLISVLIAYSAVWTTYAIVAKATQGIHSDMGEVVAWSWDLEWGTPKHPPLLPALVNLWFSVFPLSDWAYYLLAVTSTAVAIYFTWLLSGFWLRGTRRAAVPFLLMLIPFYNFLALKLNHNVILIPLWAITSYAFMKSFETRSILWSILTGIFAGLAVLAKYWSFFLLLGLATAVLADGQRLRYLKSWAPWIITVVSFCLFLPHIIWLEANHYPTFIYAQDHLADSWADLVLDLFKYVCNSIAYVAAPLIVLMILVSPTRSALMDILCPRDRGRRFAAVIFWVPLVAAIPFAIFMRTRLSALWTMSAFSFLGVVLLSSPHIRFTRKSAAAVATIAIVLSIGALIVSPLVAIGVLWGGGENQAVYTQQLAAEVQRQWDQTTAKPLRLVESIYSISNSVVFYVEKKPLPISFFARTRARWETSEILDKFGAALICPVESMNCRSEMKRAESGRDVARHVELNIQPHWLGLAGEPRSFIIDIVPPQMRD